MRRTVCDMAMTKLFLKLFRLFLTLAIVFSICPSSYSKSNIEKIHFDKTKVPKGCASCHVGHGRVKTAMLPERKDLFCFICHGYPDTLEKALTDGIVTNNFDQQNIKKEFEKPYRHPVERTGTHKYDEILPEIDPSMPRHVECEDCHHHHYVSKENKMLGLKGTYLNRSKGAITNEYELCFNCHSYSANLPLDQTNKAELFNTANPSFHPVIGPGKNTFVPSLLQPLTSSSQIKCSNCHGNDDPLGPKGPHGSQYNYLLFKSFSKTDGPESVQQYELCYSCHSRVSILNNESFQYHNLHISNEGASCRTCHNPHGSTRNLHLIDFENYSSIRPSKSGRLSYISFGPNAGQCYLNCHDKDHDPEVYPKGSTKPATQPSSSKKKK